MHLPTPSLWASRKPFGLGEQRPNNYLEIARAAWESRDRLPYAWRILNEGVCDGCALGTAGMRDWTLPGTHLCNVRLRLLRLNTMVAFESHLLADVAQRKGDSSAELRAMGRLPCPLLRRRGDAGFTPLSWDDALELLAGRMRTIEPERMGFYLTSRGMPNETYYAAQKAVRALGCASIDNAARVCHAPSTLALKDTIGSSATTCSYRDWLESELIVFIGANVANNQPVAMKYLHYAKKAGVRVAVVNPYREPGMERYWVPSVPESALFGTRIADRFFQVDVGGDAAFLSGVLKHMLERGWVDRDFVARHTTGFEDVERALAAADWQELEQAAGLHRGEMLELARMLGEARRAVLVWSMGVTQHAAGEDTVRTIVNVALARGFVGRDGCGLMPIRGHSGVQGGAEMGCYATALPGGDKITPEGARRLSELWGFPVPDAPGHTAPQMLDAAHEGELDLLLSVGGNFLEVMPDPEHARAALARVPVRVHVDIVASSQMLVEPADVVLLLPATTRYEVAGGVTETSTERRVIFSPEIPGPRVREARPEWWLFGELAARVRPDLAQRVRFDGTPAIRADIARTIPHYRGIEGLAKRGDQFQYGGRHVCAGGRFPLPGGRARFTPVRLPAPAPRDGRLKLVTRRGKQFNSMVQARRDALTGATREAVFLSAADAGRLELADGDAVVVRSETGELPGRVLIAPVKPGTVQVHWPEGNVLIRAGVRSPESQIPDYSSALVEVEPTRSAPA